MIRRLMRDLAEVRVDIDKVDKEILNLFQKRMELACQVAEYKIATGKSLFFLITKPLYSTKMIHSII